MSRAKGQSYQCRELLVRQAEEIQRDKAEEEQVRSDKDMLLIGLLLGGGWQVIGARSSWGSNQLGDPS